MNPKQQINDYVRAMAIAGRRGGHCFSDRHFDQIKNMAKVDFEAVRIFYSDTFTGNREEFASIWMGASQYFLPSMRIFSDSKDEEIRCDLIHRFIGELNFVVPNLELLAPCFEFGIETGWRPKDRFGFISSEKVQRFHDSMADHWLAQPTD